MTFSTRDLSVISSHEINPVEMIEAYKTLSSDIKIIEDGVYIETTCGQIAIYPNPYAVNECDSYILAQIRNIIPRPLFYILRYTSTKAAEEAIRHWPDLESTLIDNNFGRINTVHEAICSIEAGLNWIDTEKKGGGYGDGVS